MFEGLWVGHNWGVVECLLAEVFLSSCFFLLRTLLFPQFFLSWTSSLNCLPFLDIPMTGLNQPSSVQIRQSILRCKLQVITLGSPCKAAHAHPLCIPGQSREGKGQEQDWLGAQPCPAQPACSAAGAAQGRCRSSWLWGRDEQRTHPHKLCLGEVLAKQQLLEKEW